MTRARISKLAAFALTLGLLAQTAPASAGVMDFVKKIFKVATSGAVTIKLPGSYPLGPTPLVLRDGSLTLTTSSATARIKLTAMGLPLCTATLHIDSKGASLDCDADFKVFKAHLGGHFAFDFSTWGLDGSASLEVAGFKLSGVHLEVSQEGFRAVFTILGIDLAVGPVKPGDIWDAVKSAALKLINPYELAKKAAKAIAAGAKKVAGAVADGAKAVASGAKAVAGKIGGALSSVGSALFGGVGLMDSIKAVMAKKKAADAAKAAQKAEDARAAKAKLAAMCEAFAGRIVRDASGLDKAEAAAKAHPMTVMMRLPPFNCDVPKKVAGIVAKVKVALAAVSTANQKIMDILKPVRALDEAKKRGLVKFHKCAVVDKKAECTDLWPHLDATMRALAEKYAARPVPKRKKYRRAGAKSSKASSAKTQGAKVAAVKMEAAPLPQTLRLAQGLGFRVKADVKSPFVFGNDKYFEPGDQVKVVDVVGVPGTPGAFCQVSRKGKLGFIRCDGAFFRP